MWHLQSEVCPCSPSTIGGDNCSLLGQYHHRKPDRWSGNCQMLHCSWVWKKRLVEGERKERRKRKERREMPRTNITDFGLWPKQGVHSFPLFFLLYLLLFLMFSFFLSSEIWASSPAPLFSGLFRTCGSHTPSFPQDFACAHLWFCTFLLNF